MRGSWLLVLSVLLAAASQVQGQDKQEQEEKVKVQVTAVSGRSVYLDKGRDAGLSRGDLVTLLPTGRAPVHARIETVSRTSSRLLVSDPLVLRPGVEGHVMVPASRLRHRTQLGTNCQDCHNEVNWVPKDQILRHNRTRFPLVGAHAGIACWRCHEGAQVGNFLHASTRCETCHQSDLAKAVSPNHLAMGWTTDCRRCHVPIGWKGPGFVHHSFPLVGKHAVIECAKCHQGNVFQGTSRRCEDCHQADLARALNPNHSATGWTSQCDRCHVPSGWSGANFVHTTYPLTGAHVGTDCARCHVGNVYKGTSRVCSGCHLDAYNATTSPNHKASSFPTNCESCHSTTRWQGAVFNHRFPLQGPHNKTCATCHTTPTNFKTYSCLVCHEHRQSKMDDEHREVRGYSYSSTACVQCHPNGRER